MKIVNDYLPELKKQIQQKTNQVSNRTDIKNTVQSIIKSVIDQGDQALIEFSKKFDQIDLTDFKVNQATIEEAYQKTDPKMIQVLTKAAENITSFHKMEIEESVLDSHQPGVIRGTKVTPLAAVGVYVPGGTAAYPSSVLMNVLPAKIAGVKKIVMCTPPKTIKENTTILAAAKIAGVDEIYQIGGAQAIAALAYGTESIPRVDKITGPGNAFVAEAKKQVYGKVAIDMIAGPYEICIIADQNANPNNLASDLLSQAEHDQLSRSILITTNQSLAQQVSKAVNEQLKDLPRKEIAAASIQNEGMILVVDSIDDGFELVNEIAPEHLEVQLPEPMNYLNQIENAGSVFFGEYASEPLGDYLAGPNHILPTGGSARFFSPLGVYDFVKRTQFVSYTKEALEKDSDSIITFARNEGLDGHARAIEQRFKSKES